jgi:Tol biopolymer transport system component
VRELATGKVRQLTKSDKPFEHLAYSLIFSPDSRKIAYAWYDENGVFSLWLVNLDGSGNRPLVRGEKEWNIEPSGWFPDGAHILAVRSRSLYFPPAACQIVSVAVSDGSLKVLRELGTAPSTLESAGGPLTSMPRTSTWVREGSWASRHWRSSNS